MADINVPAQPIESNFLGYSRGQQPNTALAGLFQDTSQALAAGNRAVTDIITQNIRTDVTGTVDEIRETELSRLGVAFADNPAPPAPAANAPPEEVAAYQNRMAAITQARRSGVLPESHYWAQLDVETRRIRQKYPGHRQVVDQIVQEVTGANPANRSIAELRQELAAGRTAEDRRQDQWEARAAAIGIPTVDAQGRIRHWRNLQVDVTNRQNVRWTRENDLAGLNLQQQQGQLNRTNAETGAIRSIEAGIANFWVSNTNLVENFNRLLSEARTNPAGVTEQRRRELTVLYGQIRGELQGVIHNILHVPTTPGNQAYAALIGDGTRVQSIQRTYETMLNNLGEAIGRGEWGIVEMTHRELQAIQNRDRIALLQGPSGESLRFIHAMQGLMPSVFQNSAIFTQLPQVARDLQTAYTRGFSQMAVTGRPLVEQLTRDGAYISNSPTTPGQPAPRGQLANHYIRGLVSDMTNSQLELPALTNYTRSLFGSDNINFLQRLNVHNMPAVYQMIAGDERLHQVMYERIRPTNPELYDQYSRWMVHNFGVAARQVAQNITSANTTDLRGRIGYDIQTNTVVYHDPQNRNPEIAAAVNQMNQLLTSFGAFERSRGAPEERVRALITERVNEAANRVPNNPFMTTVMDTIRGFLAGSPMTPGNIQPLRQRAEGDYADLLNRIGRGEAGRFGYNTAFGLNRPHTELTNMTLAQVQQLQEQMVNSGSESSAVGRYQFIRPTFQRVIREMGLDPSTTRFTPELQDRMAIHLLRGRGLDRHLANPTDASREALVNSLAQEWAAIARTDTGASHWSGVGSNRANIPAQEIRQIIRNLEQQRGVR